MFKTLLISASILILIVFIPVIGFFNSTSYFQWQFGQFDVYKDFQLEQGGVSDRGFLDDKFASTLNYINFRARELDPTFFSSEDIIHMQDVRTLTTATYISVGIASSILLIFIYKREPIRVYRKASLLAILIIITLITISLTILLVDFESGFIAFHKIAFTNEYWQLDPSTSNLIKFLPRQIFQDIFTKMIVYSAALAAIPAAFAIISLRIQNHETGKQR